MKTTTDIPANARPTPFRRFHSAFGTRHSALCPAFTFIEILFSIVILGVGMIMIAGLLPVAIKQNADTRNDLTAKTVCDAGFAYLKTLAAAHPEAFPETCGDRGGNDEPFAPKGGSPLDKFMGDEMMGLNPLDDYTPRNSSPEFKKSVPDRPALAGRMMPISFDVAQPDTSNSYALGKMNANAIASYPLAWHQLILGDRIVSSEPRFQWLAFYRRDENSNIVHLRIVAMRQQNGEGVDRYGSNTTLPNEQIDAANGPFLVPIEIEDSLTETDKVRFTQKTSANVPSPYDTLVAEPGSYLIIAHSPPLDGNAQGDLERPFRNNGRVFKLGTHRDDLEATLGNGDRVWDLASGYDLAPAAEGNDGIIGTADDLPDGSMNTTQSFVENAGGSRSTAVTQYRIEQTPTVINAKGTTAWAWLIGKGRLDPTAGPSTNDTYQGSTQDLGVLSVDLTLP